VKLNRRNEEILDELAEAYQNSAGLDFRSGEAWRKWVCRNLNDKGHNPRETCETCGYSLECYFSYSPRRIAFAILVPLLISIATGISYQVKTGDVQTAWSIASYIVTAAAGN